MKKLLTTIFISFIFITGCATSQQPTTTNGTGHVKYGMPSTGGTILTRTGYILSYDKEKKDPIWVSYELTAEELNSPQLKRSNKFAPDPDDPKKIIATIALETLHIRTAQQTPPDKMQQNGPHFGILGIEEVDVSYAGDLAQMAVIRDLIRAGAGQGALNNLDTIIGANEANRHKPRFIKKMELLQVLRNPRATTGRSVLQAYALRDDPVIKARLKAIVGDERYDPPPREKATEVLADKVDEAELIGIGL